MICASHVGRYQAPISKIAVPFSVSLHVRCILFHIFSILSTFAAKTPMYQVDNIRQGISLGRGCHEEEFVCQLLFVAGYFEFIVLFSICVSCCTGWSSSKSAGADTHDLRNVTCVACLCAIFTFSLQICFALWLTRRSRTPDFDPIEAHRILWEVQVVFSFTLIRAFVFVCG